MHTSSLGLTETTSSHSAQQEALLNLRPRLKDDGLDQSGLRGPEPQLHNSKQGAERRRNGKHADPEAPHSHPRGHLSRTLWQLVHVEVKGDVALQAEEAALAALLKDGPGSEFSRLAEKHQQLAIQKPGGTGRQSSSPAACSSPQSPRSFSNLISDLRATTTAWESCRTLPVDDTLPPELTLPVPKATTWNPAAAGRQRGSSQACVTAHAGVFVAHSQVWTRNAAALLVHTHRSGWALVTLFS